MHFFIAEPIHAIGSLLQRAFVRNTAVNHYSARFSNVHSSVQCCAVPRRFEMDIEFIARNNWAVQYALNMAYLDHMPGHAARHVRQRYGVMIWAMMLAQWLQANAH